MNANELADELENTYPFVGVMEVAATMLRQQQNEIEALKQIIDANNLNQNIGQFVKPTNEPVAWMDEETGCFVYSQYEYEDLDEHGKDGLIPLYTHPVQEQDESFDRTASHMAGEYVSYKAELTDEDRSMLIRTLKWAEDLLRVAGHDEAVSDVQDCIMLLRKASKK